MSPIQRGIETYKSNMNSQQRGSSHSYDRVDFLRKTEKNTGGDKSGKKDFSEVLKKKLAPKN